MGSGNGISNRQFYQDASLISGMKPGFQSPNAFNLNKPSFKGDAFDFDGYKSSLKFLR